jgi:hypothetical protein
MVLTTLLCLAQPPIWQIPVRLPSARLRDGLVRVRSAGGRDSRRYRVGLAPFASARR